MWCFREPKALRLDATGHPTLLIVMVLVNKLGSKSQYSTRHQAKHSELNVSLTTKTPVQAQIWAQWLMSLMGRFYEKSVLRALWAQIDQEHHCFLARQRGVDQGHHLRFPSDSLETWILELDTVNLDAALDDSYVSQRQQTTHMHSFKGLKLIAHAFHYLDRVVESLSCGVGHIELVSGKHTFSVAFDALGSSLHLRDTAFDGKVCPIGKRVALFSALYHVGPVVASFSLSTFLANTRLRGVFSSIGVISCFMALLRSAIDTGYLRAGRGAASSPFYLPSRRAGTPASTANSLPLCAGRDDHRAQGLGVVLRFDTAGRPTILGGQKICANQRRNAGEAA